MNPITRAFKAVSMRFASGPSTGWFSMFSFGRTSYDYAREVGDGSRNSIVMACVLFICRTFPEAPPRVSQLNRDNEAVEIPNHPLKLLLNTPNTFYSGRLLWAATLADRTISGNAYWLKVRSSVGRVVELWWLPSTMVEPKWPDDGSEFISYYEYKPGIDPIRLETRDVVHFRYDMFDPKNIRKGYSPIQSLLREIFTDDEGGNYTAAMLRNVGVPPVVISPDADSMPTEEELQAVKERYQQVTTGANRGQALVMTAPTKVQILGFNPQQMDLSSLRDVAEERVSAVLGIPAAVVGLGTGLENTKVGATMKEMREQAWESNIKPTQDLMADEIRTQLLPEFGEISRTVFDFDRSKVSVLQQDENELHERARADLLAGGITLNEFREMIGQKPLQGEEGDALYVPGTVTPTAQADLLAPPEPQMTVSENPPRALPPGGKILSILERSKSLPSLGVPLNLTDEELALIAAIEAEDLEAARALWHEAAPDGLEELLDATAGS